MTRVRTPTPVAAWTRRDLLALRGLEPAEIRAILRRAKELDLMGPRGDELRGRTVATLFFEDSTRTRLSFTLAARRLGAEVIDLGAGASSVNKGESIVDTARVIHSMGVDAVVVRAKPAGAAALVAESLPCSVVNAGDGRHEHPTQGLLDAYALARATGRDADFDLSGLTVLIVGDVVSSRVARSNIAGLRALGARVVCVGPPALAPVSLSALGCEVSHDFDALLPQADAVMMLRVQFERHEGGAVGSSREFRSACALTRDRAARLKPAAWIMHPGPINKGLELDADLADSPRSLVLQQVRAGVPVRMACLELCLHAASSA